MGDGFPQLINKRNINDPAQRGALDQAAAQMGQTMGASPAPASTPSPAAPSVWERIAALFSDGLTPAPAPAKVPDISSDGVSSDGKKKPAPKDQ